MNENTEGQKINNKYLIQYQIGKGTFGDIFIVTDGNSVYVAKIENTNSKNPQLIKEAKIITNLQGGMGIPAIQWYGTESFGNIMIIEFLGPNLDDLFNLCEAHFSLKTVIMLADQFLLRIEFLHSRSYIHRDLKPENFVVGLGKKSSIIHLIDYGLSKQYRDPKTHVHSNYNENRQLVGTARYASVNSHLGVELSRRDDLESIGYMLVYFLRGHLPWQGVKAANKQEKYHKIMEKKMSISPDELCRELPLEFSHYLSYCRSLAFEDKPDYTFLRRLFYQLHAQFDYEWDYIFDWNLPISANCNKSYHNGNVSVNVNLNGNTRLNLTDDKTPLSSEVTQRRNNKSLSKKTVIKKTSFKAEEYVDCQTEKQNQSKKSKTFVDSYSMSSKVPSERKQTIFNARNFVTKQSIYDRIGGQMAIDAAVEKLYSRLPLDPVVGKFFLNTDLKRQITRQKEFLSMMFGGYLNQSTTRPTVYKGRQMREIHQNIGIQETDYEIVVQELADILEELGVEYNLIQEIRDVLDTLKDDILCQ